MEFVDKPKLRIIEAIPTVHEGKRYILLRDPDGYSDRIIMVTQSTGYVLGLMDGEHTVTDMQVLYARRFGDILLSDDLSGLLQKLDEALLLDNDHFQERRRSAEEEYRNLETRPACNLGHLDGDQETWRRWIDQFFSSAGDPESPPPPAPIRALVVPHIDLRIGGPVYASAWRSIAEEEAPDLIIVIGTCHRSLPSLVSATTKNFDTPLGTVKTDHDFVRRLSERSGGILLEDELAHRIEHSVEFQALFVRHLYADHDVRIVPIVCAYTPDHLEGRIERVVEALRRIIGECKGRVLLVASADLSHVGPRYGDREAPSAEQRRLLETFDRDLLDTAVRADAAALSAQIAETGDRTRVCGYPPIHLVLSALGEGKGSLLRYEQSTVGEDGSIVSHAALAIA